MPINDGLPFRTASAPDLGLTRHQLRELVRTHQVRRLFHGVFVDFAVADSRELRVAALGLVIPPGAIVSDHSAAWVYGVDTFPPGAMREMRPMCVVPHGSGRPKGIRAMVRQTTMPDPDHVTLGGIRVTSPVRTASDLLRLSWRPHALAAADALVRGEVVTHIEVSEYVSSLRRLPGTKQAQELAPLIDPGAQTPGESWMRLRLVDAGLPVPKVDHRLLHRGREYWLDAAYVAQRVAVEYDGREVHTDETDQEHDSTRRETLSNQLSWRFVVATFERVFGIDDSFERKVGEFLGLPVRARSW